MIDVKFERLRNGWIADEGDELPYYIMSIQSYLSEDDLLDSVLDGFADGENIGKTITVKISVDEEPEEVAGPTMINVDDAAKAMDEVIGNIATEVKESIITVEQGEDKISGLATAMSIIYNLSKM